MHGGRNERPDIANRRDHAANASDGCLPGTARASQNFPAGANIGCDAGNTRSPGFENNERQRLGNRGEHENIYFGHVVAHIDRTGKNDGVSQPTLIDGVDAALGVLGIFIHRPYDEGAQVLDLGRSPFGDIDKHLDVLDRRNAADKRQGGTF